MISLHKKAKTVTRFFIRTTEETYVIKAPSCQRMNDLLIFPHPQMIFLRPFQGLGEPVEKTGLVSLVPPR